MSSVPDTCGLPTEYVRHFSSMMDRHSGHEDGSRTPYTGKKNEDDDMIKMQGWMKIRKYVSIGPFNGEKN